MIDLDTTPTEPRAAGTGVPSAPQASGAHPEPYDIYPGVTVTGDWVDCTTEDECVILEVGCCNHCNGGAITAVNKAFAAPARALIQKKLAETSPCPTCTKIRCDAAAEHELVCMTRACHVVDLEGAVESRIWGESSAPSSEDAVILRSAPENVVESR